MLLRWLKWKAEQEREKAWRCPWCGNSADRPGRERWQRTSTEGVKTEFYKICQFPKHKHYYPELPEETK